MKRQVAVITGASSGIGEALAEALAVRGTQLVLVARSAPRLEALAERLRRAGGVAHVLPMDLAEVGAAQRLHEAIRALGLSVDTLINNAGTGYYGPFEAEPTERLAQTLHLNIVTLAELTRLFVPELLFRKGTILNIASTAAFQSLPYMAVYGATKAFVLSFTEALWGETKKTGVKVLAVCPGPTATEFFDSNGNDPALGKFIRTSENVIDSTFKALQRRNSPAAVIDGPLNKIIALISRFSTRRFSITLSAKIMKPKKKS
jgi:short-subunit dehydrogenase